MSETVFELREHQNTIDSIITDLQSVPETKKVIDLLEKANQLLDDVLDELDELDDDEETEDSWS